jgi:hypothetical protein
MAALVLVAYFSVSYVFSSQLMRDLGTALRSPVEDPTQLLENVSFGVR